jgi:CheY-like chemotaxis protein
MACNNCEPRESHDPDELLLVDDEREPAATDSAEPPWRVLVVDDEPSVLDATELVLKDHRCAGRRLALTLAHSATEARAILAQDAHFALALVDVVMETEHAGLELVDHIRQEPALASMRVVVRSGQAGRVDRETVLARGQVDGYWSKTELSASVLRQSVCETLRAAA